MYFIVYRPTGQCTQVYVICYVFIYFLDGRQESVMFDKITSRVSKLCYGLNPDFVDPVSVVVM